MTSVIHPWTNKLSSYAGVDPSTPNVVALLEQLVSIRSFSGEEGPIADFFEGWLRDHGLNNLERIGNNIVVRVEGAQPGPTFLLNSHLDTVGAAQGWESDPWKPFIDSDDRLVGLGSGDAKGPLSAMACATVQIAQRGLARGTLLFVASICEERGRGGMDTIRPQLGHIDAGFVGEPTSLDAAIAQGGLLIVEGVARGRASHAARPHLGVNALTIAAQDMLRLNAHDFERVHPFLGKTIANITVLNGGDRHNVIPDLATYTIDARTTPAYTHEELFEELQGLLEAELRVRSLRLRSVDTSPDASIVHAIKEVFPDVRTFGSPTMSDWAHVRDMDGIKFGPGDSERSHTANESICIHQLRAAVGIYAGTIERFMARASAEQAA